LGEEGLEIRFTAEAQRSQRKILLLIQSGDGDWIRNSLPPGLRMSFFDGYGSYCELGIRTTGTFLFGGISPPNKNFLLCGLGDSAVKTLFGTSAIH
jgi:hypothetical protein